MPVELPIVSAISTLIVLVPLPFHWKTRNVCTASVILWLAACNIIRTFNTIFWFDNATVKYKIWCDITTRVMMSGHIAVPAATVCICRRLAHASTPYYRAPKPGERRQRVKFEIGMCIVLPIILSALHVIVEPHRFAIMKGFGCNMCYYPSLPSLVISEVPAILFSWASLVYSGVTLRWMIHRRVQFRQAQITPPTPASGRYIRIVALAITQMTFALVMSLFMLTVDIHAGIYPWTSWEDVHESWHEISIHSRDSMPELYWVLDMVGWYFLPTVSITTFGFFGFDDRVFAEYRSMFAWIKEHTFRIGPEKPVVLPLRPSSANAAMPTRVIPSANAIVIDMGGRNANGVLAFNLPNLEEAQSRTIFGES